MKTVCIKEDRAKGILDVDIGDNILVQYTKDSLKIPARVTPCLRTSCRRCLFVIDGRCMNVLYGKNKSRRLAAVSLEDDLE